ncbi:MAG: HPF/RaiA family ribosome-associated protein, partial [Pyrinomonadaceae bacterium]|nr:HPF/RaiA family ribosome-associated protein [Pyrinomonadaceae bacterium]
NHAHVIIEVEREQHRSEIIVKWRNQVLTATSTVKDMYQSLSQTIQKIEKQALRLKNKIIDKSHKAKPASEVAPVLEEVVPESSEPSIINEDSYETKPMSTEEAAIRLEEDGDYFLVFRDASNERVSVMYKRKDGNLGLIQP